MPSARLKLESIQCDNLPIPGAEPWYANEGDPALLAMVDYRSRSSVTVEEDATIDAALEHLKHTGVRCAFVVEKKRNVVVGMVTAYDISGEKPQKHMHFTGVSRDSVQIKDIMQKIADWRVVNIKDVEQSTVRDVLAIFLEAGVTHLPVMETLDNKEVCLRGLLSSAKVKRLLAM